MIALRVADNFLDIDHKTRLRLQLNNPLLSRNVIAGEYSFPFRLPATPRNIRLLDFGSYLETTPDYPDTKTAWLYLDGLLLGQGLLNVHYQGLPYIDTNLKLNASVIAQYKNKLLSEFNWGPNINLSSVNQYIEYEVITANALALVIMDKYFPVPVSGNINAALQTLAAQVNAATYNGGLTITATVSGNRIRFTANWVGVFPELRAFFNTTPQTTIVLSGSLDYAQGANQEWNAHMSSVNAGGYPQHKHVFFPVLNRADNGVWVYATTNTIIDHFYQNYYDYINQQFAGRYMGNQPNSSNINLKPISDVTPFLYVTAILDTLFQQAGQLVDGFFHDNFPTMKTVVWSNRRTGEYSLSSPTPYNLRNYLPPVTVEEFLQVLCDTFCLGITSKNRGVSISVVSLPDLLTAPALDWSSKVNKEHKIYSERQLGGVLFQYEKDDADEFSKAAQEIYEKYVFIGMYPDMAALPDIPGPEDPEVFLYAYVMDQAGYVVRLMIQSVPYAIWAWKDLNIRWLSLPYGDQQDRIEVNAADPLDMVKLEDPYLREEWLVPQVKQTYATAYTPAPCKVRFLNYLGMQPNKENHLYPLGSSDNLNFSNSTIGQHSLRHDRPTGYYNKYWKKWVQFLSSARKVELEVHLTTLDLLTLDFSKRIYINGHYYLIYDLKVELPLTKPTLVTLLRIR